MNKKAAEWVQSLIEALIIVAVLYLVCWPLRITGDSMDNTFLPNDRVFISRALVFFNMVNRNHIVVCRIPIDGVDITIIKRIIAIPGDTIKIVGGNVYVNNRLLTENYVLINDDEASSMFDLEEIILEDNEFFVMGDNRLTSYDSRHIGPVTKDKLIGRVILKWYPLNRITLF
jgi:signal peptidase I